MAEFVKGAGSLCGPFLLGVLHDISGSYHWTFIGAALVLVLTATCGQIAHIIFMQRQRQRGRD